MNTHHPLRGFALAVLAAATASAAPSDPQQLWDVDLAFPLGSSERIAVDSTGHTVACSGTYLVVSSTQSHHLFQTTRIDPSGQVLWTREVRPAGGWNERAYWLTVDSQDNVIVTGRARPTQSSNFESVTVKYDPAGNELWRTVRSGTNFGHTSVRVEVDGSDNVYLLGTGDTSGSLLEVTKLDPAGNVLWSRGHTPVTNVPVRMNALAVGHDGRVAYTCAIQDLDFFSRCYDTDGNLLWSDRLAGGVLGGQDIAFDGSGAAYVCGSLNGLGVVVKYGPAGGVAWTAASAGPVAGFDIYRKVAVDGLGYVAAIGQASGTGAHPRWDVIRVAPDGTVLWGRAFDADGHDGELGRMLTVDDDGAVYAGGTSLPVLDPCSGSTSDVDTLAVKYDRFGQAIWTIHARCSGGRGTTIAVAPGGDVVFNTPDSVERWAQGEHPTTYCEGVPNSTGNVGHLGWSGTADLLANDLVLEVTGTLPPLTFGMVATSRTETYLPNVGGLAGTLCVGTPIGRGAIFQTDAAGSIALAVDNTALPTASGVPAAALAGEAWHFQLWHRDVVAGAANANFTDALRVTWQ